MKGRRASTFVMIAIVAVLMAAAVLLINHTTIFQEGNPLPVVGGIWQVAAEGKPYAQIKDEPATYITRTGSHSELFGHLEAAYGVSFREQAEDGLFLFEGEGGPLAVDARQYPRYYQIWEVKDTDRE